MGKESHLGANRKWQGAISLFLSCGIGLILVLVVWLWWRDYERQVRQVGENKLELTGQFVSEQFEDVIKYNIRTLQNLKSRIEITNGDYFEHWTYDAQLILAQNPSFVFVEWIDSNMVIQRVEPVQGNDAAIGFDISSLDFRREKWLQSVNENSTNITQWVKLTQGGYAFLVDAPVSYNGRFQGTITAGMDFTSHFDDIFSGREMYDLEVRDSEGVVFYKSGDFDSVVSPAMKYESNISINPSRGQFWTFTLIPNEHFFAYNIFLKNKLGLVLGWILAALIGIVFYFMLKSSRESQNVKRVNTELYGLNKALEEEKLKAQNASRIKTEFVSNMSHEIRTPLNAILGLVSIMKLEKADWKQQHKYFDMIEQSAKNLLSLVNDILDIDKVESGKVRLRLKPFYPNLVIAEVLDLYEEGFKEKGIYLKRNFDSANSVLVQGDPVKFGQVITNLVRNAFKFTQEGGVEVGLEQQVESGTVHLKIRISDTGIGIPPESRENIFDRFSQVETGLRKKYEGTGLGLAITKTIVETVGGSISVRSEEGKGSVFEVDLSFPLLGGEEEVRDTADDSEVTYSGRILIAEDNPMNVMVLKKSLESFDLKIDVVGDGLEVLNMVKHNKYDLIFMDIHMPEMDGIETTRQLRAQKVEIPIVAISANVTHSAVEEAMDAGVQDYVTKPFTREVLMDVLNKYFMADSYKNQ